MKGGVLVKGCVCVDEASCTDLRSRVPSHALTPHTHATHEHTLTHLLHIYTYSYAHIYKHARTCTHIYISIRTHNYNSITYTQSKPREISAHTNEKRSALTSAVHKVMVVVRVCIHIKAGVSFILLHIC